MKSIPQPKVLDRQCIVAKNQITLLNIKSGSEQVMSIVHLTDFNIDDYTNYRKECLYYRHIIIKDPETLKEIERVKVTFVPHLERQAIDKVLSDRQLGAVENANDVDQLEFPSIETPKCLSEEEMLKSNMLVYEFYGLSKQDWDALETTADKILSGLEEYLDLDKCKSKRHVNLNVFDNFIKMINECIDDITDIKLAENMKRFLEMPVEKQSLVFTNRMNW